MSGTISVVTIADQADEAIEEEFTVTLTLVSQLDNVELAADATVTAKITDYALLASVSGPDSVPEGDPATFTVTLDAGGDARGNRTSVTVTYTTADSTADAPDDYTLPSGTLVIPVNSLTETIEIPTQTDTVLDHETLAVRLTEVTADAGVARLGTPDRATTTIADSGAVDVTVGDISVEEGDPAVFTIKLDGEVAEDVTVEYATADGTGANAALDGQDYTAVDDMVVIAAGQTEAMVTVETMEDNVGEGEESFTLTLSLPGTPPAGVGLGTPAMATATITDDDIALFPVDDLMVPEGETRPITLTLQRELPDAVKLGYSIAGGDAEASDYSISVPLPNGTSFPLPPMVAFDVPPRVQMAVINVSAVDDDFAEADEWFTVDIWHETSGGQRISLLDAPVRVTIDDNDVLLVSVSAPETVAEGDVARFTVTLGGGRSTADVNVTYSVGGSAKAPADYTTPNPTMVSIPAGDDTATIPIQTRTDKLLEPDETLVVTLTEASTTAGSAVLGSPRSATTAIQDPVYHSINRVNQTLLPGITRASAAGALDAVSARMALAAQGDPPAATADLTGLTGLYRALQANEQALQDGSYDLARVLGGSSFLVPLSSHDGDSGGGVGAAIWGGGDFRAIGGGDADADDVDWDGSVWSARLGADLRFVDSLLTGLAVSWTSGGLDYVDQLAPTDR